MKIQLNDQDAKTTVMTVSGRIDANTYKELQDAVNGIDLLG